MTLLNFLMALPVHKQEDFKIAFTTYTFYKESPKIVLVDCTTDGWESASFELPLAIENDLDFMMSLNWK